MAELASPLEYQEETTSVVQHQHTGFDVPKISIKNIAGKIDEVSEAPTANATSFYGQIKFLHTDSTDRVYCNINNTWHAIYDSNGQAPLAHAVSHQNGGSDEIDVTGLSGILDEAQYSIAHSVSSHQSAIGTVDMNSHRIINLDEPTQSTDAATKNYVDTVAFTGTKLFTALDDITANKAVAVFAGMPSTGKIYEANTDCIDATKFIGFAPEAIASGIEGTIKFAGIQDGFTGLVPGTTYYLQDAAGAETNTISQTNQDQDADGSITWNQTFKPTKNLITKIQLYLKDTGGDGEHFYLKLLRAKGGAVSTWTEIGAVTVLGSAVGTTYDWADFTFATPVLVVPGETLAISWTTDMVLGAADWGYIESDDYANGLLYQGDTPTAYDACFKIFEKDTDGEIGTSAGSITKKLGIAISQTELLINNINI